MHGLTILVGMMMTGQLPGDSGLAAQRIAARQLLIIAHRGDSGQYPENTGPAFRAAVTAGADLVELDYHHSADGVPVVIHDKTLDRTTDALRVFGGSKLPVAGRPLADLQRLDAGAWFHARFAGTRLPTLDEALDEIQAGSVTLVERKAGDAATCIALLQQKKLLDTVVVQAFDWEFLAACHRLAPSLVLGALGSKELAPAKLAEIERTGARVVGWNHEDLKPADIRTIQAGGRKVWVYTVDDPTRAKQLIANGVDGIITNKPGEMIRLRESKPRR